MQLLQPIAERHETIDTLDLGQFAGDAVAAVPARARDGEQPLSFRLAGHPNELAPGKRPRVTLSPTLVTAPDKTVIALSTPGGDNQDQSLLRVLFHSIFFGMNAEFAVESPRFQTEHLVSSFDNHAMSPGTRVLVGRARENKQFLFLFVNNRLEGNAPSTSLSLVEP